MSDDESKPESAPSRKHIAYHEAAHFVVAHATNGYGERRGVTTDRITIKPGNGTEGHVAMENYTSSIVPKRDDGKYEYDQEDVRNRVLTLYAGYCAEMRLAPSCHEEAIRTAESDFQKAEKAIYDLTSLGDYSLLGQAVQVVAKHWMEIEAIAQELLKHETLDQEEAEIIIDVARGESNPQDLETLRKVRRMPHEWPDA